MHAASVYPEPGSNSPSNDVYLDIPEPEMRKCMVSCDHGTCYKHGNNSQIMSGFNPREDRNRIDRNWCLVVLTNIGGSLARTNRPVAVLLSTLQLSKCWPKPHRASVSTSMSYICVYPSVFCLLVVRSCSIAHLWGFVKCFCGSFLPLTRLLHLASHPGASAPKKGAAFL